MVHNENDHLIDEKGNVRPERGDNNDGAALIVIDDKLNQVRACLFTPGHLEGDSENYTAWTPYTPMEYFKFYYPKATDKDLDDNGIRGAILKGANIKPVSADEFNQIMSAAKAGI